MIKKYSATNVENFCQWPSQVICMEEEKKSSFTSGMEMIEDILNREISKAEIIEQFKSFSEQLKRDADSTLPIHIGAKKVRLFQAKYFDSAIELLLTCGNGQSLHCLNCETTFTPKSPKAKFCSDKCRVQYHRRKI